MSLRLRSDRAVDYLAVVFASWWVWRMAKMALFPLPYFQAESTMVWSTHLLLQGQTPWSLAQYPASLNIYGIGYPFFCEPWAWLFGCTVALHRFVSLACLLGASGLVYGAARRLGLGSQQSVWAALSCLAAWAVSYTPIAKPDGLATLVFLLSLFLTESFAPSLWRAALAGLLGVLAFLIKPYGVLGFFCCLGALIWRGRWKEAALALLAFALSFAAFAVWLRARHPLYFESVLLVYFNFAAHDKDFRWVQWRDLGLLCGAFGALALAALLWPGGRSWRERLNAPWVLPCLAAMAVFHFVLSLQSGAYLTYFLQLAWPCLVLAGAGLALARGWGRALLPALLLCSLALAWKVSAVSFRSLGDYQALDQRMTALLAPRNRPSGRGYAALWLWPRGSVTMDYGQGEAAPFAEDDHAWPRLFPSTRAMKDKRLRFERCMATLVRHKHFGVLALGSQEITPIEEAALAAYQIRGKALLTNPQAPVCAPLSLFYPRGAEERL